MRNDEQCEDEPIDDANSNGVDIDQMNANANAKQYADADDIESNKRQRQRQRQQQRHRHRRKYSNDRHQLNGVHNVDARNATLARRNLNAEQMPMDSVSAEFNGKSSKIHMNTDVKRAILWIKVDAIKPNKSTRTERARRRESHHHHHSHRQSEPEPQPQQRRKNHKKQLPKRNEFTLWVFRIAEPYCKRKNLSKSVNISI